MVKEFYAGRLFQGVIFNVTPVSESNAVVRSSRADAVIDVFAAYIAAVTRNALQWAEQPPKLPIPIACTLDPILVYPPIGISIRSAVFAWFTNVTSEQTDTQTDHATLCLWQ